MVMIDSNRTMKFNRTARESYGHSIEFNEVHFGDRAVGIVAIFVAGFLLGLWVA
jgi:hypothetical protein